jgi:hypothetical protein
VVKTIKLDRDAGSESRRVALSLDQAAEKLETSRPAPKGAIDFEGIVVSLKRYPDTKHEFFAARHRRAFSFHDAKHRGWKAGFGSFAVLAGSSSAQIELRENFSLRP